MAQTAGRTAFFGLPFLRYVARVRRFAGGDGGALRAVRGGALPKSGGIAGAGDGVLADGAAFNGGRSYVSVFDHGNRWHADDAESGGRGTGVDP